MKKNEKVIVIGGTGLVGYHTCLALLEEGYEVVSLSSGRSKSFESFPPEIKVVFGDVFNMSDSELLTLFKGSQAIVYSVGPDDRDNIPLLSLDFFYERLVIKTKNTFKIAQKAGIKKAILIGDYFTYIDRTFDKLKVAKKHPYVYCRSEQSKEAFLCGNETMDVMVMELPYIFGDTPHKESHLLPFIEWLKDSKTIYHPKGGTAVVSVQVIAATIVRVIKKGQHGKFYPVVEENMTWNEIFGIMLEALNLKYKKIVNVPRIVVSIYGRLMSMNLSRKNIGEGINLKYLADIKCEYLYIDKSECQLGLESSKNNIIEVIETVCRKHLSK